MIKTIKYDEEMDEFVINLHVPRTMTGRDTYGDGTWEQDAVCVWIDNSHMDYALHHTQYLDYKDSLQATAPIIHFDSQQEAIDFAKKYNLMIEYGSNHDYINEE